MVSDPLFPSCRKYLIVIGTRGLEDAADLDFPDSLMISITWDIRMEMLCHRYQHSRF